jgi:phenylpyruvate tautomerase PptA (4-oxalocrotonate tautomerase family)
VGTSVSEGEKEEKNSKEKIKEITQELAHCLSEEASLVQVVI